MRAAVEVKTEKPQSTPVSRRRRLTCGVMACFVVAIAAGCSDGGSTVSSYHPVVHPVATESPQPLAPSATPDPSSTSGSLLSAKETASDVATETASGPAPLAAAPASDVAPATATSPAGSADSSYPPASDCSVDARGMAAGTTRSCQFTATDYGGWWAGFAGMPLFGVNNPDPSAAVWVTRGTSKEFYMSDGGQGPAMDMSWAGCDNNIIQPGDLVEVVITAGEGNNPGSYYEAGAGLGWSCDGHP